MNVYVEALLLASSVRNACRCTTKLDISMEGHVKVSRFLQFCFTSFWVCYPITTVADPGFSRGGGREPSRGGVNTPNFPENCMKSKEFGRPGGGRASLTPPPRSANERHWVFISECNCNNHSESCRYDATVNNLNQSVDANGQRRGGGVCIDCTNNTGGTRRNNQYVKICH